MLMAFTRAKKKSGEERGWFRRMFRRRSVDVDAGGPEEPAAAYPKAAE
jgi:hypothetical protein